MTKKEYCSPEVETVTLVTSGNLLGSPQGNLNDMDVNDILEEVF